MWFARTLDELFITLQYFALFKTLLELLNLKTLPFETFSRLCFLRNVKWFTNGSRFDYDSIFASAVSFYIEFDVNLNTHTFN